MGYIKKIISVEDSIKNPGFSGDLDEYIRIYSIPNQDLKNSEENKENIQPEEIEGH